MRNVVHAERSCWFGYSKWIDRSFCVLQVSNINYISDLSYFYVLCYCFTRPLDSYFSIKITQPYPNGRMKFVYTLTFVNFFL
jgi:hypothetical protein